LTVFTFDELELKKLQVDLFNNPEKYEKMLLQDFEMDPWLDWKDFGEFFTKKEKKA
jgi:hypothetical protein